MSYQIFKSFVRLLFLGAGTLLSAQMIPINTETLRQNIVFLYDRTSPNPADWKVATGFLVGVVNSSNPNLALDKSNPNLKTGWAVLVTARHVVDPEWAGCSRQTPHNPKQIEMRLNTKTYNADTDPTGTDYVVVHLQEDGRPLWFHHDRDDVDVAVIPFTDQTIPPIGNKAWFRIFTEDDAAAMPLDGAFATPDTIKAMDIGSSVVTAGLVPELAQAKRNYPTYRYGRISNIFPEPLDVPCDLPGPGHFSKEYRIWSVAANYVHGNSGSPVFALPIDMVTARGTTIGGSGLTGLVGLVSLGFPGSDFSGITPVSYIFDVVRKAFQQNGPLAVESLPRYQYPAK
jgi:hypothetical protein